MSPVPTPLQALEDLQAKFYTFVRSVYYMRQLQKQKMPFEPMTAARDRGAAEDQVDSLTQAHLIPPPPSPATAITPAEVDLSQHPVAPELAGLDVAGLRLQGRAFADPYFAATLLPEGVRLRADDHKYSITWFELTIPEELIARWNRLLCSQEHLADDEQGQFDEV